MTEPSGLAALVPVIQHIHINLSTSDEIYIFYINLITSTLADHTLVHDAYFNQLDSHD